MLKKTITYTDFNDVEKTESFYFNLTKTELMRIQMEDNSFADDLQKAIDTKDAPTLVKAFEKLILASYGEKTSDGRFAKSDEITRKFTQSAAYDEFFMGILNDETGKSMLDFINAVMPADLVEAAKKQVIADGTADKLSITQDA